MPDVQRETLRSQGERRRSQRTRTVKPVEVARHAEAGIYVWEQAETDVVSAHGALLRMKHNLPIREVITLRLPGATNWTMARVMRCDPPRPDGWTPVAVELAVPNEAFWGLLFWSGV